MSFNRTSLYRREVRIFVADCFPGSRPERHALMRQVLHKLRQHCDTLHVSVTIVDLLFQVPCDAAVVALLPCKAAVSHAVVRPLRRGVVHLTSLNPASLRCST